MHGYTNPLQQLNRAAARRFRGVEEVHLSEHRSVSEEGRSAWLSDAEALPVLR